MSLRVLDLTLNLPGPYATALLARQGATVCKVEPPRGDPARHMPAFFEHLNEGKRSVVLDLRDPSTHPSMSRLVAWADVLIEGFRPGVMERLQWGPASAHAINPRLVYCRISAFGQAGDRRDTPGHDLNLQALTGLCTLEGAGSTPRATMLPIADFTASLHAVAAIQQALSSPREGAVLDIGMADALLSMVRAWDTLDPGVQVEHQVRSLPRPLRRLLRPLRRRLARQKLYGLPQYGLYAAADGWLAVGIVDEQHFWERFAEEAGLHRAKSWSMPIRTLLGPLLEHRIRTRLRTRTVDEWLAIFEPAGIPVTEVLTPTQASAQFTSRDRSSNLGPAPALGADTIEQVTASPG